MNGHNGSSPTERDPLLHTLHETGSGSLDGKPQKLGPLEISRSTRYGILAGVWVATFLSVCTEHNLGCNITSWYLIRLPEVTPGKLAGYSVLARNCDIYTFIRSIVQCYGSTGANQMAVVFAALGTAACGFSGSMEMLIAARFLSGIGGGGIMTTATIIMSDMYSLRSRGLTQGVGAVFNSEGPLGGFIADRFGWRWAFIIQLPLFVVSFLLTSVNLRYVTPGKSKSTKEVLKRIDYFGSLTLMCAVLSVLIFLSTRFSEEFPWSSPAVYVPFTSSFVFFIAFVLVELYIAPEPVLAPFLLRKKIPVLVGISNFFVATCNFAVMYNFPTWFQTVMLTSASEAGAHLIPNGVSISLGSLFAGWMMHRTGKYKLINMIFGLFPFTATILLSLMREDSPDIQLWLSILPMGFGNAVVLQTMLIALLAHLPQSAVAVGTGFGQLFRGIGQVGGVALSSALFQSILNRELRKRIQGEGSEELISRIRHSATLVAKLPPDLQRKARDSYAIGLRAVFIMSAIATFIAYCARIPIPDKSLDSSSPRGRSISEDETTTARQQPASGISTPRNPLEETEETDFEDSAVANDDESPTRPPIQQGRRRLSTYESQDGVMDLEGDEIGGSARRK